MIFNQFCIISMPLISVNEQYLHFLRVMIVARFKERKEEVGVGVTEARSIY